MFPGGSTKGLTKGISETALNKTFEKVRELGTPHGLRTSFRSWIQDTDAASFDVAETALAHTIGKKVERSYARSDLLDRRRALMQAWADYVTNQNTNVLLLKAAF